MRNELLLIIQNVYKLVMVLKKLPLHLKVKTYMK